MNKQLFEALKEYSMESYQFDYYQINEKDFFN